MRQKRAGVALSAARAPLGSSFGPRRHASGRAGRPLPRMRQKVVQLDSRNGRRGITPDVRIPHIVANLAAHWAAKDVEFRVALGLLRKDR